MFISLKTLTDDQLTSVFRELINLKASEDNLAHDMRNCTYPTFDSVQAKGGDIDLEEFVKFFKYFAQEQKWNVPISEATMQPIFAKESAGGKWSIDQLISYLKKITTSLLKEMKTYLKSKRLFIGSFFLLNVRERQNKVAAQKELNVLKGSKQDFCNKLFAGQSMGLKQNDPKLLEVLRATAQHLPVERVTSDFEQLLNELFPIIDKNKDGIIDTAEMVAYVDDVTKEFEPIIATFTGQ